MSQVGRLAAALVACLEHWSSAIGILAGFARVPVFRDPFIEHNSEIPVKLLSRANEESFGGLQEEIARQSLGRALIYFNAPRVSSATCCFACFGICRLLEIV